MDELSKAVVKLLYFKIEKGNIEPWKEYYYPEGTILANDELYMNCGIPQGLPQSYYFGNLCMIEVKRLLLKDDNFKGDAYFYVDDSVIYVQSKLTKELFVQKIKALNTDLENWCQGVNAKTSDICKYVGNDCLSFQNTLCYRIKFHEDGKSVFTNIDEVDNLYGPISNITRETSLNSKLAYNLDEIDDHVSLKKLKALDDVISREIIEITNKQKEDSNRGDKADALASRLKLLKRFKKYFLYRNRLLKIREKGGPDGKSERN